MRHLARALLAGLLGLPAGAVTAHADAFAPPIERAPVGPVVTIDDITVTEGNSGSTAFTARARLAWHGELTVDIQALGRSGNSHGLSLTTTQLRLLPGLDAVITGQVRGDLMFERDETFRLIATSMALGSGFVVTVGGLVTIVDDDRDRAPYVSIASAGGTSVPEGDDGLTTVTFEVRLEAAATYHVLVEYHAVAGTAEPGSDYQRIDPTTIVFAPGEVAKTAALHVIGDRRWESDEVLQVALLDPYLALVRNRSVEVRIVNDDARPDGALDAPAPGEAPVPPRDASSAPPVPARDVAPSSPTADAAVVDLPEPAGPNAADGCDCSLGARTSGAPLLGVAAAALLLVLRRRRWRRSTPAERAR